MHVRRAILLSLVLLAGSCLLSSGSDSRPVLPGRNTSSTPKPASALSPGDSLAQLADLNFDVMGVKQGLPHDSIYGFAQDRNGFLWIGTFGGLARFDGYEFQTYLHDPRNPASLPDNNIRLLMPRSNGGIWIATGNAGVVSYDPWSDSFHPMPKLPAKLKRSHVFCMSSDGRDGLWFGSQLGLVHYDAHLLSYEVYGKAATGEKAKAFSLGSVFSVLLDSGGNLWVGGDHGLFLRPANKKEFEPVLGLDGEKQIGEAPPVWTVFEDKEHRIWVGADTSGLGLYNPTTRRVEGVAGLAGANSLIGEHTVRGMVEVKPGRFLIATYGNGLITYDANTGIASRHVRDLTSAAPLSNNFIRGIYMDPQGLVWLGTDRGLSRLNSRSDGLLSIHSSPLRANGLFGNEVRSVTATPDNRIWLGFDKGEMGMIAIDGSVHRIRLAAGIDHEKLSQREVLAIKAANENEIYAGGVGLYLIDGRTLVYRPVANPLLAKQVINALLVDGDDLWAGTYNGLIRYNRVSGQAHLFAHDVADSASLSDNYVRDILRSSDGKLWITTRLGLDHFDPSTNKFSHIVHSDKDPESLPNDNIQPIVEDAKGRLWIGTIGGGVTVLWGWKKDGKPSFRTLNRHNGFPDDIVLTTMKGKDGRIWCNTPSGLAVIDPDTLQFEIYTMADGLRTTAQNLFSSATLPDGTILFPGDEGLMVVRPSLMQKAMPSPSLVISEITIPGDPFSAVSEAYRALRNGFVLPTGKKAFQAEFALLDYAAAPLTRYSYRLEGFDKEWSPITGENRSATYTNLPPGKYLLRFRAKNRIGPSVPFERQISIEVPAAWYETLWFRSLLVLVSVGVVLLFVRIRTAVLRKSEARLEKEVELRTSQLREANSQLEILATRDALTGLMNRRSFLSGAEEEISRARELLSEFTILLLDVDRFKSINDTYGHGGGDAVLVALARILKQQSRETDYVARYGGEEFVVLLSATGLDAGRSFAERICVAIAKQRVEFQDQQIPVTASIGVANSDGSEGVEQVLQRADQALYRAKNTGRNRVSIALAMTSGEQRK